MATNVKGHSRSVKGKGNTTVKKHSRKSKVTKSKHYRAYSRIAIDEELLTKDARKKKIKKC